MLYSNKVVQVKNLWTDDVSARNLDLAVGLLETNLPSCVSIVPIMGSNLVSKVGSGQCLPVIQLNQDKQAHVNEVNTLEPNNKAQISFRTAICSWRSEWSLVGRSGDSGSPVFALLGNQLVLLGSLHTAMGTPSYCDLGDLIQQAMNELLPSHNNILQRYNLDRWADLPIRNEERQ